MDEIFGKINSEINIKRYKREYMSHFEVLRDTIFTALKKNQTFAALYNGNYLRETNEEDDTDNEPEEIWCSSDEEYEENYESNINNEFYEECL
ncbi:cyclic GMP-AMP synthase-like receptor isoform X4 [Bactrocera dorsalis]|uniref:Cyclic GMP-AMP synthase-like receptor isoform X4 n=1 Tax=Bactrocera dorsalis TaxID=27457 RepID=A0ABM3JDL6_BACDO|nr:cyclic GMP-AMP synthase-like receptor isoform X4 [Bactrocera dorsalis]